MIHAKITSDGNGVDVCEISIEEKYSEDALYHIMTQLKELNHTVLIALVNECGFDPEKVSSIMGNVLLRVMMDFRTEIRGQ